MLRSVQVLSIQTLKKGFIKAEVISYDDLMEYGSELKTREAGKS